MTETAPEPNAQPRRRKPPVVGADVVATIQKLPRNRMHVPGSGPPAEEIAAAAEKQRELTEMTQRNLLGALVQNPDPKAVAAAMGWSLSALEVYLTDHKAFAERYETTRQQLATANVPAVEALTFIWTEAKRSRLIEEYIDSGDLLKAQEAIGCTPSQFNREIRENVGFKTLVDSARAEAEATFEMRARAEAMRGNDKLLAIYLRERGDTTNDLSRLTDTDIDRRLSGLLERARARAEALTNSPSSNP